MKKIEMRNMRIGSEVTTPAKMKCKTSERNQRQKKIQ